MEEIKTGSPLLPTGKKSGDAVLLCVRGEIDLQNSPQLRAALNAILADHKPQTLVLNLQAVPYMDSSAIAVLVEMLKRIRKTGGKICLTHLQPRVRGLIEIARLHTIFVLAETDEEAMKKQSP